MAVPSDEGKIDVEIHLFYDFERNKNYKIAFSAFTHTHFIIFRYGS